MWKIEKEMESQIYFYLKIYFIYIPVIYGPSIKDDQMLVVWKCQYNQ